MKDRTAAAGLSTVAVLYVIVFYSSAVVYLRVGTSLAYQNGRGLLTHNKQTNPLANHSKK